MAHELNDHPKDRLTLALIVGIVALVLIARILPGPRTIDDAFITFRYSRNILEGQGFVYNPGSRVLGTTTPLFTVIMAVMGAILRGEDFQWYAIMVSAVADASTAVFLFLLAYRLTRNRVQLQNRLESLLEGAPTLVSDLLGASARRMLHAVATGETDPPAIAALSSRRLNATPDSCEVPSGPQRIYLRCTADSSR